MASHGPWWPVALELTPSGMPRYPSVAAPPAREPTARRLQAGSGHTRASAFLDHRGTRRGLRNKRGRVSGRGAAAAGTLARIMDLPPDSEPGARGAPGAPMLDRAMRYISVVPAGPLAVYRRKIKPLRVRLLLRALASALGGACAGARRE